MISRSPNKLMLQARFRLWFQQGEDLECDKLVEAWLLKTRLNTLAIYKGHSARYARLISQIS